MTPGLAGGPPFPKEAKKGSIVAIASVERPTVPMVVGICEVDVSGLQKVQGEKGRAVRGIHWDGDELWAWSTGQSGGANAPESIDGWNGGTEVASKSGDSGAVDDAVESQEHGGVLLWDENGASHSTMGERDSKPNEEDKRLFEEVELEDRELSTKGMQCAVEYTVNLWRAHHSEC